MATVIDTVRIVDGTGSRAIPSGRVVIESGRIIAAGSLEAVAVPRGAEVIDASGCTVVPGLIDAHMHDFSDANLADYVRNGVTSVRLAGGDPAAHALAKARIAPGKLLGPRIFTCGRMLDASPLAWPSTSIAVDTVEDARRVVTQAVREEHVDAIIATTMVDPETLAAIVETAHALGVTVTGQIWRCSAADAIAVSMDGLDNTSRIPPSDMPLASLLRYESVAERLGMLASLWERAAPRRLEETACALAERGIAWVPCLVLFEAMAGDLDARLRTDPHWPSASDDPRPSQYDAKNALLRSGWSIAQIATQQRALERIKQFSKVFHDAGGSLVGGSDLTLGGIVIHREIAQFVDAGLTALEAIRAVTQRAAAFLGRKDLGLIASGAAADLVVVRGDASSDIRALRQVEHVFIDGQRIWGALAVA